jgi:hypothetical protein
LILIAVYEVLQDWRRVKGRTTVRFQHPAYDRLIGEDRRCGSVIVGATLSLDSGVTETPKDNSHQSGLAAQPATSPEYRGPVTPDAIADFPELVCVYCRHYCLSIRDYCSQVQMPRSVAQICFAAHGFFIVLSVVSRLRPFLEHQLMGPASECALTWWCFTAFGDGTVHLHSAIGLTLWEP